MHTFMVLNGIECCRQTCKVPENELLPVNVVHMPEVLQTVSKQRIKELTVDAEVAFEEAAAAAKEADAAKDAEGAKEAEAAEVA